MKRSMSIFLALVLVLSISVLPVFAEKGSKGGGNVIPDIHLREAINNKLGLGYVDDDVTLEQVESLTGHLSADGLGILKLEGLQYATNLEGLNLEGNKITDISPLSSLMDLKSLSIAENKIADFTPLSGLTKLEVLNTSKNTMGGDLNFLSNLINLKYLSIGGNSFVSNISAISNLVNLEELDISGNLIHRIDALQNLEKLWYLDFSHNRVSDISPLKNKNIIELKFSGNRVADIRALKTNTLLDSLEFNYNQVSDISPLKYLDLTVLFFENNNVSDISPLSEREYMMGLSFANNNVSDISPLSNLKSGAVNLSGNRVRDISALSSEISFKAENQRIEMILDSPYEFEVEEVNGYYNEIIGVSHIQSEVEKNGDVYKLLSENSDLTWSKDYDSDSMWGLFSGRFSVYNSDTGDVVPDNVLKRRINFKLGKEPLSAPVTKSEVESLTGSLNFGVTELDGTPIPRIESIEGLQYANNVQHIYLYKNRIKDISPISNLSNLETISAGGQHVELVLDSPHEFESDIISLNDELIDLSYSTLEVSKNGDTYKLLTDHSDLEWVHSMDAPSGVELYFSGKLHAYTSENGSVIPDKNLRKAINKKLGKGEIDTAVSKAEVQNLDGELDAYSRDILSIEGLQYAGGIGSLILSYNRIEDISPLDGLTNLQFLEFDSNNVSDIGTLETLTGLHSLFFNKNKVSDLTPLRNFDFFYALRFNENRVSDISPLNVNNYIGDDQKIEKYLDSPYEFESELIGINGDVLDLSYVPSEISKDGNTYKLLSENSKLTWSEIVDSNTEKFSGILSVYRNASSEFEMLRLSGKDRFKTAVEVSKEMHDDSDYVIIVNGRQYPDALSSTPLAKLYDAPILLVDKEVIPDATKDEIVRLGATKAVIVGGKGVVSESVAGELEDMGLTLERYSGKDRYKTALAVAEKVVDMSEGENLILVKGTDFPDALTITALALKEEIPILLTDPKVLSEEVKSFIETQNPNKLYIAGGKGAVSLEIQAGIEESGIEVVRFSGKDRYETGKKIAEYTYANPSEIIFANGRDFADAMVGGPLTTVNGGPVMLVEKGSIPQATRDYMTPSVVETVNKAYIVGGKGAVSEEVKAELTGILD